MRRSEDPLTRSAHRKAGAYLFNHTWSLLGKPRRSAADAEEMLHAAHASRYHWGRVGRPVNFAVGEWQIFRVYSELGRAEPAAFHAQRSLEIARHARLGRFYIAYAYEALARASSIAKRRRERDRFLRAARRVGRGIRDRDDQRMLWEDLATIR